MRVVGRVAQAMLDYLKSYASEGRCLPDSRTEKMLTNAFLDETFLLWVNAYAQHLSGFEMRLREILTDLSCPKSDDFDSIFQRGLFSALSEEKLEMLASRLYKALQIPFDQHMELARKYLPKRTRIKADVYITIDPFNTGMMRPGKVFLSILQEELTPESAKSLAHEFHHVGAHYWLNKNSQLKALKNSNDYGSLLSEVLTYFVTEGLANWYTSTWTTRILDGEEEHNRVIRRLEKETPRLFRDLEQLLGWICERHKPVEETNTLFKSLSIDASGSGIPPGHFLSGHMVGAMDNSGIVAKKEIIELVKHPFDFFILYNKSVAENSKLSVALLNLVRNRIEEWSTGTQSV